MLNSLISVIVPIFNTQRDIFERCINSVLNQAGEFEIVVVDDGSEDAISNELVKVCGLDSRIKYFKKNNGGVSSARNFGLRVATGEYIVFLDSDDCLLPDFFKEAISIIRESDCDLVLGGMQYSYLDGSEKSAIQQSDKIGHFRIVEKEEILYLKESLFSPRPVVNLGLDPLMYVSNCSVLYSKSLLSDCSYDEDIKISEDRLFNYKAFTSAGRIAVAPGCWYNYIYNMDSASHSFRVNAREEMLLTADAYLRTAEGESEEYLSYVYLGVVECFIFTMVFTVLHPDYDEHFSMSRRKYVRELIQEPIYRKAFRLAKIQDKRTLLVCLAGKAKLPSALLIMFWLKQKIKTFKGF